MREFLRGELNVATDEASDHEKTYIVSIINPGFFPLIKKDEDDRIGLEFHDAELRTDPYSGAVLPGEKGIVYFNEEMALKVCKLIKRAMEDPADVYLLVNCQMGISRSGAVSFFVRQIAGIDFDDWKSKNRAVNPNILVKGLLTWAWGELNP
jgi:predicted protein tyrosine phosphatase